MRPTISEIEFSLRNQDLKGLLQRGADLPDTEKTAFYQDGISKYKVIYGKDYISPNGKTLLHIAIAEDVQLEFINLVIAAKRNLVNARDNNKSTPLMLAAQQGNLPVITSLFKKGARINEKNSLQNSALAFAYNNNQLDAFDLLMKYGAAADIAVNGSGNIGFDALKNHRLDFLKVMSRYGDFDSLLRQFDEAGHTLIMNATITGDIEALEILLSPRVRKLRFLSFNEVQFGLLRPIDLVDAQGNSALHLATTYNKPAATRILLQHKARLGFNSSCYSPVTLAISCDADDIFTALIDGGVDLRYRTGKFSSAFRFSFVSGYYNYAKRIIEAGFNARDKDLSALTDFDILGVAIDVQKDEAKKTELKNLLKFILEKEHGVGKVSDKMLEDEVRHLVARVLQKLLYSKSPSGMPPKISVAQIILNQLPKVEQADGIFTKIFTKICANEEFDVNGERLVVLKSKLQNHASFFMIKCNAAGIPSELYYVDGNCPFDKKAGAGIVKFELQSGKFLNLEELTKQLEQIKNLEDFYPSKSGGISKALREIVKCDPAGRPIICERLAQTQPQSRDNCPIKSVRLLARGIGILAYGKGQEYSNEKGQLVDKETAQKQWAEECKEVLKTRIVLNSANELKDLTQNKHPGADKSLEEMRENARNKIKHQKGRSELRKRLEKEIPKDEISEIVVSKLAATTQIVRT